MRKRRYEEEKSRFKPVNVTEWLDKYTIPVETMHMDDTGMANDLDIHGKKK